MRNYSKIALDDEEFLFEARQFIDEGSGGSAIGRLYLKGKWQPWQISGRPCPDVDALTEQDKAKWASLIVYDAETEFFKSPF